MVSTFASAPRTTHLGLEGGRTPLNPIHFNPISRINSARYTLSSFDFDSETSLCSRTNDSGEFMVIVAAVCKSSQFARPIHTAETGGEGGIQQR